MGAENLREFRVRIAGMWGGATGWFEEVVRTVSININTRVWGHGAQHGAGVSSVEF